MGLGLRGGSNRCTTRLVKHDAAPQRSSLVLSGTHAGIGRCEEDREVVKNRLRLFWYPKYKGPNSIGNLTNFHAKQKGGNLVPRGVNHLHLISSMDVRWRLKILQGPK